MSEHERCLEPQDLDALAHAPSADPRHQHVLHCARCRGLLESHRLFLHPSATELEAAHVQTAQVAMAEHIAQLVGSPRASQSAALAATPWWRALFVPAMRPALAFAALTLVLGGAMLWPRLQPTHGPIVLRGTAAASFSLTLADFRADGGLELHWSAYPLATHYRVQFYSPELVELGQSDLLTGLKIVLPAASLPESARAGEILVRVVALREGDELGSTPTLPLAR